MSRRNGHARVPRKALQLRQEGPRSSRRRKKEGREEEAGSSQKTEVMLQKPKWLKIHDPTATPEVQAIVDDVFAHYEPIIEEELRLRLGDGIQIQHRESN